MEDAIPRDDVDDGPPFWLSPWPFREPPWPSLDEEPE